MFDFYITHSEKEKEQIPDTSKLQIEYEKLWMEQSKLFWSRLQTATVLHSGVLLGWYKLEEPVLKSGILILGVVMSLWIILIMIRDGQHMDFLRTKKKVCDNPSWIGRTYGFLIMITLIFVEVLLSYYRPDTLP